MEGKENRKILTDVSLNVVRSNSLGNSVRVKNDKKNSTVERKSSISNKIIPVSHTVTKVCERQVTTNEKNFEKNVTALFIGNLAETVTEKMLKQVFKAYPSFVSLKICTNSHTRKSLGYGYVNFTDEEDAEKATEEFNYKELFGNEIKIMPSLRNSFYRKNFGTNLFFCNLPLGNPELTTRKFYDTFKPYGKILSCKLDHRKNIGFLYFDNDQSAKQVIKDFNNKIFLGNKISCGIHFDKDVRTFPEFEKRKEKLDANDFIKEELVVENKHDDEVANGEEINGNDNLKKNYPNSVFVKNLPIDVNDEEILNFFSSVGPIKSVFTAKVTKFKSSWTIITYKKSSDSIKAIDTYNEIFFQNKKINVTKAQSKLQDDNLNQKVSYEYYKKIVYLSNLDFKCNEFYLLKLCDEIYLEAAHIYTYPTAPTNSLTKSGCVIFTKREDAKKFHNWIKDKIIFQKKVKVSWLNGSNQDFNKCIGYHRNNDFTEFPLPNNQMYFASPHLPTTPLQPQLFCQSQFGPTNFYKTRKDIVEIMKNFVRMSSVYLELKSALMDSDIRKISEHVIEKNWENKIFELTNFIQNMSFNIALQKMMHQQIVDATRRLGY